MPNPTISDVHVNTPLTNISIAYFQANMGKYRARSIFPAVGVAKKSDKYYVYNAGDLLRSQAARRAPGAPVELGSYRVSSDTYLADRWSLGKDISDPERANADPQFDLDGEAAMFLTDQIQLAAEVEWADGFFTTGIWDGASSSTDMTGSANPSSTATGFLQWNDQAATPIEDVRGEATAVESKTGYRPNIGIFGRRTFENLLTHADILARIKSGTAIVNEQLLASLFGLDEVVVLNAVRESANQGSSATSVDYVAGNHALLLYRAPRPGLRVPTAGYTFVWTGNGSPMQGSRMKRYRVEENESDRIEAESWFDYKKVASSLGAFFAAAVSS